MRLHTSAATPAVNHSKQVPITPSLRPPPSKLPYRALETSCPITPIMVTDPISSQCQKKVGKPLAYMDLVRVVHDNASPFAGELQLPQGSDGKAQGEWSMVPEQWMNRPMTGASPQTIIGAASRPGGGQGRGKQRGTSEDRLRGASNGIQLLFVLGRWLHTVFRRIYGGRTPDYLLDNYGT